MTEFKVHLVGGVPLADAQDVFQTCSSLLGPALTRLPDGEVGRPWMGWLGSIFYENPQLETTDEAHQTHEQAPINYRTQPKAGIKPEDVTFENLPLADVAIRSYRIFERLKREGKIPDHIKFQCDIAHPVSMIRRYIVQDLQNVIEPAFERAVFAEVRKIADAIPHDQLTIQWDCASAAFATLELGKPSRFGATKAEMYQGLTERFVRSGEAVPEDIDLLFHYCYGSNTGRHSIDPSSLADTVEMANRVTKAIDRSVELIHMPVLERWTELESFSELAKIDVPEGTSISLGLIHLEGGAERVHKRIASAKRYLNNFYIATECGLSARKPVIDEMLRLHAEVAGCV